MWSFNKNVKIVILTSSRFEIYNKSILIYARQIVTEFWCLKIICMGWLGIINYKEKQSQEKIQNLCQRFNILC